MGSQACSNTELYPYSRNMTNLTIEINGCVLGQWLILTLNIKQDNKNSMVKEKIKKNLYASKYNFEKVKRKCQAW